MQPMPSATKTVLEICYCYSRYVALYASWQRYIGTKRVGWHYESWPELKFLFAAGGADWMCIGCLRTCPYSPLVTAALARALMPDPLQHNNSPS